MNGKEMILKCWFSQDDPTIIWHSKLCGGKLSKTAKRRNAKQLQRLADLLNVVFCFLDGKITTKKRPMVTRMISKCGQGVEDKSLHSENAAKLAIQNKGGRLWLRVCLHVRFQGNHSQKWFGLLCLALVSLSRSRHRGFSSFGDKSSQHL